MIRSRVSQKWLTTIPKEVREFLGLRVGDTLVWRLIRRGGRKVVLVEKEEDPYELLRGIRCDPELTFEKVRGLADKIIEELVDGKRASP